MLISAALATAKLLEIGELEARIAAVEAAVEGDAGGSAPGGLLEDGA